MVKIIFAHLCQGPALEASWLWMAWQPPLVFSTEERREGFSLLLALLLVPPTPRPGARYPADNVPTLVPISCMPGQFAWFRTAAPTVVSNNLLTGPPTPWRSLTKLLYPTNSCRRTKPPFRKASSTAARGGRYMPLRQIARQKFPLLFSVEKTHWNSTVGLHVLPIIDGPTPGQV